MDRRYEKRINRYWLKMEKRGLEAFANLDVDEWFDLWHTHPDWKGKGNSKPENRIRALELTYLFLKKAEDITLHRKNAVQCFAIVKENTMDNSVYIHSKNPNGSEFPLAFDNVRWGINHPELKKIISFETHEIGKSLDEDECTHFIRKRT